MFAFRILLTISIVFSSNYALTPIPEVRFNIFDSEDRLFETSILESLKAVENLFANKYVESVSNTTAFGYIPVNEQISKLLSLPRLVLSDESDWKETLANAITDNTERKNALDTINSMQSKTSNFIKQIADLNDTTIGIDQRHEIASAFQNGLYEMIQGLANSKSLFKKHALLAAPSLIALAISVLLFHPISLAMIPVQAKQLQLPCQIHDILLEFRPLTVDIRFDKISAELSGKKSNWELLYPVNQLANMRTKPFNPNGYTKLKELKCDKGCRPITHVYSAICVKDQYGFDDYYALSYLNPKCIDGYTAIVRKRVEQTFPVQLLGKQCHRKPLKPTGEPFYL